MGGALLAEQAVVDRLEVILCAELQGYVDELVDAAKHPCRVEISDVVKAMTWDPPTRANCVQIAPARATDVEDQLLNYGGSTKQRVEVRMRYQCHSVLEQMENQRTIVANAIRRTVSGHIYRDSNPACVSLVRTKVDHFSSSQRQRESKVGLRGRALSTGAAGQDTIDTVDVILTAMQRVDRPVPF